MDKFRPAIFTLIAMEEPENSLSPHYLGRVIKALTAFSDIDDGQSVIATHSPVKGLPDSSAPSDSMDYKVKSWLLDIKKRSQFRQEVSEMQLFRLCLLGVAPVLRCRFPDALHTFRGPWPGA